MNDLKKIYILFNIFSFLNPNEHENFKCMVFIYEDILKIVWSKMQRNMTDKKYENVLSKINPIVEIALDQNQCVDDFNVYSKIVKIKVSLFVLF